jgi:hypothetical protein
MVLLSAICILLGARMPQSAGQRPSVGRGGQTDADKFEFFVATYVCNGRTGFCAIDTGSPQSYFRTQVFAGLPRPAVEGFYADAVGKITIGKATWRYADFYAADKSVLRALDSSGVDGLIGMDLLREARLSLPGRGRQLQVELPKYKTLGDLVGSVAGGSEKGAVEIVSIDGGQGRLRAAASINGTQGYFMLDTGALGCWMLPSFSGSTPELGAPDLKVHAIYEDISATWLPSVRVQLGSQSPYPSYAFRVPASFLGAHDQKMGWAGVIGHDFFYAIPQSVLDLGSSAFLAPIAPPQELLTKKELPVYPILPGCAGPLIVCLEAHSGNLRVLCEATHTVFEVPADSPIPAFESIQKALLDAQGYPRELQAITLGPGQTDPNGWVRLEPSGSLPIAYSKGGKVYVPAGVEAIGGSGYVRDVGPGHGSVFSPLTVAAAPAPLHAKAEAPEHPATMVATLPGHRSVRLESDTPIEFPANWSFSCPLDWTIGLSDAGLPLVRPPGVTGKFKATPPPFGKPPADNHWRFFAGVGWTVVPD